MKSITRRQFASGLLLASAAVALAACDNAANEPGEGAVADATEIEAGLETVAEAEDAFPAVSEIDIFSDDVISKIIDSLKSDATRDEALTDIGIDHGLQGVVHGYHTDSTELQITRNIPTYKYENGEFVLVNDGTTIAYIFDGDEPVYRVIELADGNLVGEQYGIDYVAYSFEMYGQENVKRAFDESTTKEITFIDAGQGGVFYDGVSAWAFKDRDGVNEYAYDMLSDDIVSTPGIDGLERVSILERQTFAYDSPEIVIQVNDKTETIDSPADYEATLESML